MKTEPLMTPRRTAIRTGPARTGSIRRSEWAGRLGVSSRGRKAAVSPGTARSQTRSEAEPFYQKVGDFGGLIIDDHGHVQQLQEAMEVLFTLAAEGYEHRSVLTSSNLPFLKWEGGPEPF